MTLKQQHKILSTFLHRSIVCEPRQHIVNPTRHTTSHTAQYLAKKSINMSENQQQSGSDTSTSGKICLAVLAVFLPPLGVGLHGVSGGGDNACGLHMCLSIVLTLCFWIPGILHAWWYIFK